jgi:hypothetical protein
MGHALIENRDGLIVDAVTTRALGHAERLAAIALIEPRADRPAHAGGRQGLRYERFRHGMPRAHGHPTCRAEHRGPALGDRSPHHPAPRIRGLPAHPQAHREAFGWAKTVAGLRKMRHRGLFKVGWQFTLAMAAYNLVQLPKLLAEPTP